MFQSLKHRSLDISTGFIYVFIHVDHSTTKTIKDTQESARDLIKLVVIQTPMKKTRVNVYLKNCLGGIN